MEGSVPYRLHLKNHLVLIGIGLSILYWVSEALIVDTLFLGGSFNLEHLIRSENPHELLMRLEVVIVLVLFSVYAQGVVNRLKRAEEAQLQLASIVENSVDAIDSKALDGTIVSLNPGGERLYGYTEEELRGRHISVLAPPDRLDELQEILQKVRRGETVTEYETERVSKGGRRIPLALTISPVRDRAGEIVGTSAIARDISERKEAEERLRASEAEMRALFAAMTDVILEIDSEGRYLKVAPTNPSLLYKPSEDLVGKTLHEVMPGEQADAFLEHIRRA